MLECISGDKILRGFSKKHQRAKIPDVSCELMLVVKVGKKVFIANV